MADYTMQNGNITMMIRDYGDHVDLLVLTDSMTYNHDQLYSYNVNGVDSPKIKFDMNNRGSWQYITTINPSYRQSVRFTMYDARLGFGSNDFWQWIERARIPDAPGTPYFPEEPHSDAIRAAFDFGYDGGMGIDDAELWYSDDPNNAKWMVKGRDAWIGNLAQRTWYYFWGKVHNPLGWSGLSGRSQALTDGVPDAPTAPSVVSNSSTSVHVNYGFTGWDGGTPIREWQVGYGTDPNYPQFYQSGVEMDINGLQPGQTYYFWARGRNDVGWGYWSGRSTSKLPGPPAAPSSVDLSTPTSTTVQVSFAPNSNNGRPITAYQVGYGKTPNGPDAYFSLGTSPSGVVTGLDPGTLYYFWGRARNLYGWGPLSAVAKSMQTTAGAWINVNGVWKQAVPYINVNGIWKPAQVWAKIAGVWKETT